MFNFSIPPDFKNKHYKKKEKFYLIFFASDSNFLTNKGKIKIENIHRISFELSNLCNYSNIHPQCPVSMQKDKKTLSSKIVKGVINQLGKKNYKGFIAFHRYNEPLIDPRLFEFISYTKTYCPEAKIHILTNGFYLTQSIVEDFNEAEIESLEVSAYNKNEYQRLINLKVKFPYKVTFALLDSRKSLYSRKKLNSTKPCYAQINDITINCEGKLVLCCLDWRNKHIFGDLKNHSLEKVINSKSFLKTYKNLTQGKRLLDLCSRCDWQR